MGRSEGRGRARSARAGAAGAGPDPRTAANCAPPGIRRHHVSRGARQVRAEQGARAVPAAVLLDRQPVSRLQPRLHLLLCARHPHLPGPGRRARLRQPDRGQGQRGGPADRRADPAELAARDRRARYQHRSLPAGRGPIPADARHHRRPHRQRHAVLDPHQGHAARPGPAAAERGGGSRAGEPGGLAGTAGRWTAGAAGTGRPESGRAVDADQPDRCGRAVLPGVAGAGGPLPDGQPAAAGRAGGPAGRGRGHRSHRVRAASAARRPGMVLRLARCAPAGPGAALRASCTPAVPMPPPVIGD